jgi:hypothetical protein
MITKVSDTIVYMFGQKIDTVSVKCTVIWDVKIEKEIDKATLKFSFENIFGCFVTKNENGLERYSGFDFDIDDSWNITIIQGSSPFIFSGHTHNISPNSIIINFGEKSVQLKF